MTSTPIKRLRSILVGLLSISLLANIYLLLDYKQSQKRMRSQSQQIESLESVLEQTTDELSNSVALYQYLSTGVLALQQEVHLDSMQMAPPSPGSDDQLRWYHVLQDLKTSRLDRNIMLINTRQEYEEVVQKKEQLQKLLFDQYEKAHLQMIALDSMNRVHDLLATEKRGLQHQVDSLGSALDALANSLGFLEIKDPDGKIILFYGEISEAKANGRGVGVFPSKAVYRGEWKDNLRHGFGTYYWTNGDTYEGEFQKGKRHGQGTYTFATGEKYTGDWRNDLREGQGVMYASDGKKLLDGNWQNDRFKKDQPKLEAE